MRQWVTLMDGLDSFHIEDVAEPAELNENEVLVQINYVSLNYRDIKLVMGAFRGRYATLSSPIVPCSDASGTIVRVGGKLAAQTWTVGDRVFSVVRPSHLTGPTLAEHHASGIGIPKPGVLTEYRVFPASGIIKVPDYLSQEQASTLPIASITAWMALNWDRPIGSPRMGADSIVLLQGTGGVSIAALQQAHALGLTTILTSSSAEKLQKAQELGATHTINYKTTPNWADEVLKMTDGRGVDIIVETGGPGTMEQSLKAVAEGGNISAVGILSGSTETKSQTAIGLQLINRNITMKGINIGPKDRIEEMLHLYTEKHIFPVVDQIYDFDKVKEALELMEDGRHFGKMVIKVK